MDIDSARIVRYSRRLRALCVFGALAIPTLLAAMWFFGSEDFLLSGEPVQYLVPHGVAFEPGLLSPVLRLLGFCVSMIPGAIAVWALLHLANLFGCFSRLQFFTTDTARSFRQFALAVLLTGLARPIAGGLMSLVTTMGNTPGNRFVSLTAGDSEMTAVFLGVVLLVVAWVMEQGQRIVEENEQIV